MSQCATRGVMSFVHEDPEFERLLAIVARDTGISEALIEKDYWVTHTLWALPEIEMTPVELARDLVSTKDMRALPSPDEPVLQLDDPDKRQLVRTACAKIAPMYWGPRISLGKARTIIRSWLAQEEWSPP